MSERVFVSYEHQDRDFVSRLVPRLLDSGIPAWWDRETRLGEVWAEKLSQALGDCAAFLVVVSEHSQGSRWVEAEFHVALIRRMETGSPEIIPLLLPGGELQTLMRPYQYADFRGEFDEPAGLLTERLRQILGVRTTTREGLAEDWRQAYRQGTPRRRQEPWISCLKRDPAKT